MRSKRVHEAEIRRLFNEGRYYERMKAGEFHAFIVRQKLVSGGDRRIRGTTSETVEYVDSHGNFVARVHQFRWPDGSLGASGRPDPKALRHEGVMYRLQMEEDWDIKPWVADEH